MRKLFAIMLTMAVVMALMAGPVAAQSDSTRADQEKAKKLKEFVGQGKTTQADGFNPKLPPAPPKNPSVQSATKPALPQKPVVQSTVKTVQPQKAQATFVGKASEKMSPERKACVDKCEAGRASCNARCKSAKDDDIMAKNECLQCQNTIIACMNRCPAK